MTQTQIERVQLLRNAIKASGMSARRFAREVLVRDERTVRRWLTEDSPIPQRVIEWLIKADAIRKWD